MTVKIFQTEYEFTFSFFAVVCITLLMTEGGSAAACLLSSFLHEFGHLFLLSIFKNPAKKVVLGGFGMRIEERNEKFLSYKKEALVSLGGIFVNLILAFFGFVLWKLYSNKTYIVFTIVNIFIAAFNSIPVSVLDYGRFLRYILLVHFQEEKVNAILKRISFLSVALFCAFTVIYTAFFSVNFSLIAVCVYLLMLKFKERWK